MRPLSLKIIATALLGGGVVWVFSQSFWQDSGSDKPITSERGTQPARHRELPASPAILPQPAAAGEAAAARDETAAAEQGATLAPASPPASAPGRMPLGIRLADNVRLPAVIIALSAPNRDPKHPIPAPVAAAMQSIVDTFYQDLAASVQNPASAGQSAGASAGAAGGDNTVVIGPGAAVAEARARANDTYRALFGDQAYNQLTMTTAIEVRLPVDPAMGVQR